MFHGVNDKICKYPELLRVVSTMKKFNKSGLYIPSVVTVKAALITLKGAQCFLGI